ncbi:MAG: nascent polypeptide-associated complex protein [Candidatus Woesearchaeota archaeon]|nr:MAG: nascent polypeptide-associated complex protein [Candidatus Woesearchaeota archaeon]
MLPGVNPRQMQQMMKKMGIRQDTIDAEEVIIRKTDGSEIVFLRPEVAKVNMMGQESFQITGAFEERSANAASHITEEDIQTVIAQTSVSAEKAREVLEKHDGDIAEAILELQNI